MGDSIPSGEKLIRDRIRSENMHTTHTSVHAFFVAFTCLLGIGVLLS